MFKRRASSVALYEDIRIKVRGMLASDDPREVLTAEMWRGLVVRHHPTDKQVGCACAACGDPWPCKLLRDTVSALN